MNSDIVELLKFKQEIAQDIETYLDILKKNTPDVNSTQRIIKQIINYYDRLKAIYSNQQSNDGSAISDDDENFISDSDDDENIISDDDYSGIMRNRIFTNNSITKNDVNKNNNQDLIDEDFLKKKHFGCSLGYNKQFSNLDDMGIIHDSSTDSVIYDDVFNETTDRTFYSYNGYDDKINSDNENNNDDSDEEPGDCIVNNNKKTIRDFVPNPDIEIIEGSICNDDYNEPTID
jgi:hypothetical protein